MTTPRHFLGIVKTDRQTTITPTLSGHDEEEEGRLSSSLNLCLNRHLEEEQPGPGPGSPILNLVHLVIVFPFPLSSSGFDIIHRRTGDDDDGQKDQITSKHHMDASWVGRAGGVETKGGERGRRRREEEDGEKERDRSWGLIRRAQRGRFTSRTSKKYEIPKIFPEVQNFILRRYQEQLFQTW